MKNFLLLILGAFVIAMLLSATFKKNTSDPPMPEVYAQCHPADIRGLSKQEAATNAFAMLHEEPLPFTYEDKKGKMVSFKTPDGQKGTGYEIRNKKKTNNYIFVIQEWWGLNDYIKQESDNLSTELDNINVIALDLYDGKVADNRDSAMKYMSGVNNQRLESIIKGAITYAGKDAKIYTIGWCFGGMWSLQASILAGKQGAGCVMYYGRPETNIEKLKQLNADVIGFFGNQDRSPSPEMVNQFEKDMKAAGKNLVTYRYEANHGFGNPSNPSFNKEATEDANKKTIAFFKQRIR